MTENQEGVGLGGSTYYKYTVEGKERMRRCKRGEGSGDRSFFFQYRYKFSKFLFARTLISIS